MSDDMLYLIAFLAVALGMILEKIDRVALQAKRDREMAEFNARLRRLRGEP